MRHPHLHITLDGDGAWADLADRLPLKAADRVEFAALPHGMQSGAASVTIRLDCPDGLIVIGQTSLALFLQAADMFKAKYGDPRETT